MDEDRCPGLVRIYDDHWGSYTNRCDLPTGHEGEHSVELTATEPRAYMRWSS